LTRDPTQPRRLAVSRSLDHPESIALANQLEAPIMRIAVSLAIGLLPVGAASQTQPSPFVVDGRFSIDFPAKGYDWKFVTTKEIQGIKARYFLCSNEDESSRMVLIIEERHADTQAKRKVTIKAHWNTLVGLKDRGFTELSGKKPPLEEPIPDRTYYSISGKDPNGNPVFIRGATVFGKYIYGFQAFARTAADAERLIGVVKTLKETK
jgi:hypothetical protein